MNVKRDSLKYKKGSVMKIYYEINANEIPKNCLECHCYWCKLPRTKNTFDPRFLSKYKTQRHPTCPLKTENDIKDNFVV